MASVDSINDKVEKLSVGEGAAKAAAPAAPAAPKKSRKEKNAAAAAAKSSLYLDPQPAFLDERIKLFEELKAQEDEAFSKKDRVPIKVTLPDGSIREGVAFETSPLDIALQIGKSFAERQCTSKVDGQLWDLIRPLESDVKLVFYDFEHPEGRAVF